jgi:hypothetical protein
LKDDTRSSAANSYAVNEAIINTPEEVDMQVHLVIQLLQGIEA